MFTKLPAVIARSASDEAIHFSVCGTMDCFVASLLAMTEEAAGSVIAHPTTRHPEVAASSAALEGRRPGSVILRGAQVRASPMKAKPPAVIARSASDEAIHFSVCGTMDCFAEPVIGRRFAPTRWLAMTEKTIDRHPEGTTVPTRVRAWLETLAQAA